MRDRKQEEIEKWKLIIKEFHDSRKDMLYNDMDNADFCKFMTENFEAPERLPNSGQKILNYKSV